MVGQSVEFADSREGLESRNYFTRSGLEKLTDPID